MDDRRWHELDGHELGKEVERLARSLDEEYSARDMRAARSTSLYEGRSLSSTSPSAYLEAYVELQELRLNVSRSACDTVQSEIAGKQKPKPQFVTTGADYRTRRRAKKLDKFVESQLRQPQGWYSSAHELMEDICLDALICGTGIAKVYADGDSIAIDRVPLRQVRVDQEEAACGAPRNWFQMAPMDRQLALELFTDSEDDEDERRHAIITAPLYEERSERSAKVSPPIRCTEAWYLETTGADRNGRHVIVINGCVMLDEEWEPACPPFVIVRWARERNSFWGKGLVEEGEPIALEIGANAVKLQERFALCGAKRTFVEEGSVDLQKLQQNEAETIIEYAKGSPAPQERIPSPVSASEVEYMDSLIRKYFEFTGVSQMQATARKEPGVTAAIAIRTMNDMQSTRLSVRSRQYEQAFVTLGRLIVITARQVASEASDFKLPWPGSTYHGKISWKDADLDDDMYELHVAPASSLPSTPGGRIQTVQELFQAGLISPQTAKRLFDMPDLEDEMRAESAERERIEWEIDRMLDAEEGQQFEFHPPDGYSLDPQGAMVLVGGEYHQAMREGAPEYNLSLLRAYMSNLDTLIQRMTQPQQQPGVAGGLPPSPLPLAEGAAPPQAVAPTPPGMLQ